MKSLIKYLVDGSISVICRLTAPKVPDPESVLIFRKDGLGDYILFYPFLKYFRQYYRNKKITLVIPKVASGLRPLLGDFDNIIEFDNKAFSHSFSYRYRLVKQLSSLGFGIAIYPIFTREPICDMIINLTGAPEKIGIRRPGLPDFPYTKLINIPDSAITEIEINSIFTEGCTGQKPNLVFPTIELEQFNGTKATEIRQRYNLFHQKYCIVFPGTGAEYKKWPEDRFAAICDHLIERNILPIICGANGDVPCAELITSFSKYPDKIINLAGKTDIPTLAHLLSTSVFYFGNDTGAMHLAAALKIPTIGILGGGYFERFFPYGDLEYNIPVFDPNMHCKNDAWACSRNLRGDERAPCIMGISTENALENIDKLLNKIYG